MSNATPIVDRNTPAGRAVVTIVMHCGNPICAMTLDGKSVTKGPCTPVALKVPVRSPSTGALYTHQVFALAITADEASAIADAITAARPVVDIAPSAAELALDVYEAANKAYDRAVAAQRWPDITRLGQARESARLAYLAAEAAQ